jgi:hypothetical protein
MHILKFLMLLFLPATFIILTAHSITITSQSTDQLQPRFNQTIALIQRAESAGATPEEIGELVTLVDRALTLNDEALKLTRPEDAQRRSKLLAEADETLGNVQTETIQLEAVASRRTFTNKVVAYVCGGIVAFVATVAFAYGTSFWRRYRIKRTFQMRILPK